MRSILLKQLQNKKAPTPTVSTLHSLQKQTVSLIDYSINTLSLQCFLVVVVNEPQTKETT